MAGCAYKTILKRIRKAKEAILSGRSALSILTEIEHELERRIEEKSSTDPRVKELLSYACRTYQEETESPMAVDHGIDSNRIKIILKRLKPLAKAEGLKEEELFKILWDFFVNHYPKARTGGIASFQNLLQRVYEWWRKEADAPIDFGENDIATNPKFGISPEFNTKIELTESED